MFSKSISAVLALATLTSAQTFTDCNPLKKTCPADPGLQSSTFSTDFTQGESAAAKWKTTAGNITYADDGAHFTINKKGDAPTIQSDFYMLFGTMEVTMKASNGTGIVSSIVLQSDDLDEVDWEFIGGVANQVQSNYYGKGNTTTYDRVMYHDVSDTQTTSHTYTVDWTADTMTWHIDGNLVRTLNYADAVGGKNYPQTPMNVRLGIWAGGDPDNNQGTIEWAGGETNYDDAPFTMVVESVKITNNNPACEYKYTDRTGSWESIDILDTCQDVSNTTSSTAAATSTGGSFAESPVQSQGDESDGACSPETVTVTAGCSSAPEAAPTPTNTPLTSYTGLITATGSPPAPYGTGSIASIGTGTVVPVASSTTLSQFTGAAARPTKESVAKFVAGVMGIAAML